MTKHRVHLILLCLFLPAAFLSAQTTVPAQSPKAPHTARVTNGGTVRGTVKDDTGAVIPNATVTLTDQNGATRTVQSNGGGAYVLRGVAPGTYTVSAEYKGLTQTGVVAILVSSGQSAEGDVVMKPSSVKQELTVEENNTTQVSVDPTQNASQLVLKKEDLDALPDDPDDLQQDLEALAGPSAGPGGSQIYIDGFSSGTLPPKDTIREIRINQNPFSSEYDKLGYGRIEIFTKPGTDRLHGTAYYDISDGALNSRNPFLNVTPDFRTQRYGGNVSGPISKSASFFFDFDRRQIEDNGILNAFVPDASGNIVNDRSFVPTPQQRMSISPRVDWQLGKSNTLSMRYSYQGNDRDLYGVFGFDLPANGYSYNATEHEARITDTAVLSAKAVNETRFQFTRSDLAQSAVTDAPEITVPGAFTGGGSINGHTTLSESNYEFQNYTTLSEGTHNIKFGARIRGDILDTYKPKNFNGTWQFACLAVTPTCSQAYLAGQPLQFTINAGNPALGVNQIDAGLFVQDDWRVASNFTLSTGLRWEGQTNISDRGDFAPRVGFAWSPKLSGASGRPKTVIRGGFGLFYVRFDDSDVLLAEQNNGINQQSYLVSNPTFYPNIPPVTGLPLTQQIVYQIDKNLRAPYLIQSAIGVDQQLFKGTTLSVNYTNTRGIHQYDTRNINAPGTGLPGQPPLGVRPLGDIGDLYQFESGGLMKQSQVFFRVNSRIGSRLSLFGAYIWNNVHTNAAGLGSLPMNQYDLNADWGRSSMDIQNRAFIGGSIMAPWRVQLSPFIVVRSGMPYNINTGFDYNADGVVNDRPYVASGPGPGIIATPYGYLNPTPTPGEAILPYNTGNASGQFSANLRLSRTWGFGTTKIKGVVGGARAEGGGHGRFGGGGFNSTTEHRYNLTLSISARNIFNNVNYDTPVGVLTSPLFLQPTSIAGGYGAEQTPTNNRRINLSLRFRF
ncbi:MAG TPA: carboxypeptidase regulatory-like domain-containing protein [Bryobacteraceae bacterium]|nr:carboxypeptidase regulatory-like domain-containing protein [Bryobacteraceae bacterium]